MLFILQILLQKEEYTVKQFRTTFCILAPGKINFVFQPKDAIRLVIIDKTTKKTILVVSVLHTTMFEREEFITTTYYWAFANDSRKSDG